MTRLNDPTQILIREIDGGYYAFIAAYTDTAVQIADVSTPSSPTSASNSLVYTTTTYVETYNPYAITLFTLRDITGREEITVLIATGYTGDGYDVFDVSDPTAPYYMAVDTSEVNGPMGISEFIDPSTGLQCIFVCGNLGDDCHVQSITS